MASNGDNNSADERRARLKALREKRRAAPTDTGHEQEDRPAASGDGDMRARMLTAIAKKRGLKGAGAARGQRAHAATGRGAARRRIGTGAGGTDRGEGAEQFPRLRKILARRRAQGGGAEAGSDIPPEQQISALKKRLQRLSEAVERTEAELAAVRQNAAASRAPRGKAPRRKKAVAKKVAAKVRARQKDGD